MKKHTVLGEIEICDAHAHFFSHNFFTLLAKQSPVLKEKSDPILEIGKITGFEMPSSDPIELGNKWITEFDGQNVTKALLIASLPNDEQSIAQAVKAFPDRIYGGFFFNPLLEHAAELAKKAFDELNLKVICLFPAMHHYSIADNETVKEIANLVSDRKGTAIFVHCGALSVGIRKKIGLKSPFDLRFSDPLEVHKLASEFPSVNFIIPHFGAGFLRETLMAAELCPNIYLDTSSSNKWINYLPDLSLKKVFQTALETVGANRLLFGTDSSFFPRGWNGVIFEKQVELLAEIGIEKNDADQIFGKNLQRIMDSSKNIS